MKTDRSASLQTLIINMASFWAQFAISMVNLALVYHMRLAFNLSAQMVGLSAAIYTSTYFACCLLLGPFASRLKPRHSVELSMVGMSFATFIVMTTGKEGRALNRATSSFNVSWSLGAALSPFLTGILLEHATGTPLLAGIILFILVFLIVKVATMLVPGIRAVVSEKQNLHQTEMVDSSTPLRFLSWAGVLTVYASLAVTLTIFPLHAMDNLPFSESIVGFLLFVRGISTVGMFVVMGKTSIWHFNKHIVLITQILVAMICLFGTIIEGVGGHILFFFLFGILFSMSYSYSIFHGASGSVNRSHRMLLHEVLLTIGTVVGSVVGGTIYQYLDFATVLYACAALVMVPVLGSWVFGLLGIKRV
jgi:DHA1 family multidrug resistance protein-like MFS transporter/DHA1 family quinolone resistance protein-like MFS transporter